mmetsp:Transcript_22097/g.56444  ORF Transcript_22097/g.56444 Transcript_22097/m.56444 type:complete len:300 (-) Transcript_22097:119-1018(-)
MEGTRAALLPALAGASVATCLLLMYQRYRHRPRSTPAWQCFGDQLSGCVLVVTGGSSGIGRAIAMLAASKGAHVIVCDTCEAPIEGGTPITDESDAISFMHADVTRSLDLKAVVDEAVCRWGRLDVWVNNAAIDLTDPPHNLDQRLLATTEDQWARVHTVNTTGYFNGAKLAVGQFVSQAPSATTGLRGKLINIVSQHGMVACPGNIAYGTSKAAAAYMTKQIAVDYAKLGITCNAVAPGKIVKDPARGVQAYSYQRTPCPRLGEPKDVAAAVCWLASDEASQFITGSTIMVDGGWMAF